MMTDLKHLIIYTAAYLMSYITGRAELSALSSICLICAAVFLYYMEHRRTRELLNLRGLMALGILGGEGIARLQLSRLSTVWTDSTWLSFYLFYLIFYAASGLTERLMESKFSTSGIHKIYKRKISDEALFRILILSVIVISWTAFIYEAINLRFIPLFTVDTPHAYSYFHLKGIHYFTTLNVLVPGISMLYLEHRKKRALRPDAISILGIILPLLLSVLLVSRFQFMFSAILALFTATSSGRKYKLWQAMVIFVLMIMVYVGITVARAHSVEYLNGIFEMKNPDTPIFITQPYMYIANNFDNFNVMTRELTVHSNGIRMLYPFLTLTGLKFINQDLAAAFPLFTTKEELTTLTLIYDAWYDFGLMGVTVFALVIGMITGFILYEHKLDSNPFAKLIYAELAFYFSVSFFTTWFSNPATWFYLGFSVLFYLLY
ncbi:O-antigen polymerase [Oribacterium sp. C9]|uniref:O-antigen polymerase n=1 Tax=Oribacterium sp. C9 TaxID=1943579 RepID=UPI00098FADCB|nr:O-antigen polymerase [Oribacterium sp. C9]